MHIQSICSRLQTLMSVGSLLISVTRTPSVTTSPEHSAVSVWMVSSSPTMGRPVLVCKISVRVCIFVLMCMHSCVGECVIYLVNPTACCINRCSKLFVFYGCPLCDCLWFLNREYCSVCLVFFYTFFNCTIALKVTLKTALVQINSVLFLCLFLFVFFFLPPFLAMFY